MFKQRWPGAVQLLPRNFQMNWLVMVGVWVEVVSLLLHMGLVSEPV